MLCLKSPCFNKTTIEKAERGQKLAPEAIEATPQILQHHSTHVAAVVFQEPVTQDNHGHLSARFRAANSSGFGSSHTRSWFGLGLWGRGWHAKPTGLGGETWFVVLLYIGGYHNGVGSGQLERYVTLRV